jgi:hypothetical protein
MSPNNERPGGQEQLMAAPSVVRLATAGDLTRKLVPVLLPVRVRVPVPHARSACSRRLTIVSAGPPGTYKKTGTP